jgi:hypothetical protein
VSARTLNLPEFAGSYATEVELDEGSGQVTMWQDHGGPQSDATYLTGEQASELVRWLLAQGVRP